MALTPGTRLGPYEVISAIGAGGMGEVYRGRENLIAGTDCGFAQEEINRRVHPSIMWAKLEAMAEGARIASGG